MKEPLFKVEIFEKIVNNWTHKIVYIQKHLYFVQHQIKKSITMKIKRRFAHNRISLWKFPTATDRTTRPEIARFERENSREICQVTLAYRINLAEIDVEPNEDRNRIFSGDKAPFFRGQGLQSEGERTVSFLTRSQIILILIASLLSWWIGAFWGVAVIVLPAIPFLFGEIG